MLIPVYSDELYHHDIKGQKWGIRRYQNDDGTLTEEGKRRYGYGMSSERKLMRDRDDAYKAMRSEFKRQKAELKKAGLQRGDYKQKLKELKEDLRDAQRDEQSAFEMGVAQTVTGAEILPTLLTGIGALSVSSAAEAYAQYKIDDSTVYTLASIPITALSMAGGAQTGWGIGSYIVKARGNAALKRKAQQTN